LREIKKCSVKCPVSLLQNIAKLKTYQLIVAIEVGVVDQANKYELVFILGLMREPLESYGQGNDDIIQLI
jgi:hypothetical protein